MRRALAVALLLSACAMPRGVEVEVCDGSWRDVDSVIVRPRTGETETETVPVECIRQIDDNRVRIGFAMPPGPSCYVLTAVDSVEAADAVSITVSVAAVNDPAAGACPEEAVRTATEIDLQAAVGERALLDGSRSSP